MARTRGSKQAILDSLSGRIARSKSMIFVSLQGLKVKESEQLRKDLRSERIDCVMAKKTLLARSLVNQGLTENNVEQLKGEIAVCCGFDDEVAPARIAAAFAKKHETFKILAGIIRTDESPLYLDGVGIARLASLPSKDELRAKVVGCLANPMRGCVSVLVGNLRSLVQVLNAYAQSKS